MITSNNQVGTQSATSLEELNTIGLQLDLLYLKNQVMAPTFLATFYTLF